MTTIAKAINDPLERAKWHGESARIAKILKEKKDWGGKQNIKVGIAFDDQIVTVELDVGLIEQLSEADLADTLYEGVLETQNAAPQASAEGPVDSSTRSVEPAAAAVVEQQENQMPQASGQLSKRHVERCLRRFAPTFAEQCPNDATGGVRLKLYPHERFQKRYGRRPMLQLILHLPVCSSCFTLMVAAEVIASGLQPGQWGAASKLAQQRNNGVLPIKEESVIEHVLFSDPEYVALRAHLAKHHPEVLQSAPAGSQQQEAGNGKGTGTGG